MWTMRLFPALIAVSLLGCDAPPGPEDQAAARPMGRSEGVQSSSGSVGGMAGERSRAEEPSARPAWMPRQGQPAETAAAPAARAGIRTGDKAGSLGDQALYAQRPQARIEALRSLVKKDRDAALPVVTEALQDSDAEVREQALRLIHNKRMPVAAETLHDVAVNDPSDRVRGAAWVNLSDRNDPDLREYLLDALNDPNPEIRRSAQQRLKRLERANR